MIDRRIFLVCLLLGLSGQAGLAVAKDGDSGGDGGDSDGGSDDSGGKDDSGGDRDDSKDDRDDSDDDRDDDSSKSRNRDGDKIRKAVAKGEAEPLRKILSRVRRSYKGQVVKIRLTGTGRNMLYRIRLIDPSNKLLEVRVNAKSGRIVGTASP